MLNYAGLRAGHEKNQPGQPLLERGGDVSLYGIIREVKGAGKFCCYTGW